MKLSISNIELAITFLGAIQRIAPGKSNGCLFTINNKQIKVNIKDLSETFRCFFISNCITAESETEFAFCDISKLIKALEMIIDIENKKNIDFEFNKSFIEYNNDVKFKLKVDKKESVEKYIANDIKTELIDFFSFKTSLIQLKKVIGYFSSLGDNYAKIYFTKENEKVLCEFANKSNILSNALTIPISTSFIGNLEQIVALNLDMLKTIINMPGETFEFKFTDKNAFLIKTKLEINSCFIESTLLTSFKKI